MKPLQDVRILDLSHSLAGPFASMLLANLGADVIKIEPPAGDETRTWGPHVKGESAYFISTNRGLKSVCVDLKMKEGQRIVHELARNSDVVIENFRPGVAEKLGVEYEELKKHKLGYIRLQRGRDSMLLRNQSPAGSAPAAEASAT